MATHKHNFKLLKEDFWYCTICNKQFISQEIAEPMYKQLKKLKQENKSLKMCLAKLTKDLI